MFAARNTKSWPNWPIPTSPMHTRYAPVNPEDFFWDPRYHTAEEGDHDVDLAVRWAKPSGNTIEYHILEGLQGKEKQYVLKLAQSFEALIRDGRATVVTTPLTAYQRFLVYCCSVFYGLAFGVFPYTHEIYNVRTPSSRIPQRRVSDMVPPELTTANLLLVTTRYEVYDEISKARLISRLVEKEKKRETGNSYDNAPIHASDAEVGEGGYIGGRVEEISTRRAIDQGAPSQDHRSRDSDAEHQTPSEEDKAHAPVDLGEKEQQREDGNSGLNSTPIILSGAVMGKSNATQERDLGSTSIKVPKRQYLSMAERQAAYEEARSRIFMDFEEKSEPAKGKRKAKNEGQIKDGNKQKDGSTPSRSTHVPGSPFDALINNSNGLRKTNDLSSTFELESPNAQTLTPNTQSKSRSGRSVLFTMPLDQVVASAVTHYLNETEENNTEEDMSESASVSGTIYSHASSRTKSTDYGFYYRRMALSQESLVEGSSMFSWRQAGVE